MDEAPHSSDTETEAAGLSPTDDVSAGEAPAEPDSAEHDPSFDGPDTEAPAEQGPDQGESSFDEPETAVEETYAAESEPEPAQEPGSAEEPEQEQEPREEPESADELELAQEPEGAQGPEQPVEPDSTAPELVLEPAQEPEAVATDLTLDDMVAEIVQSQGGEATPEGEPAPEGAAAEAPEGEAAEGPEGGEVEGAEAVPAEGAAEPSAEVSEEGLVVTGLARDRMSTRIPFWGYGGVWVVFVGVMTYLLWPASVRTFTGSQFYAVFVLGGGALTVVGLFVGLLTWFFGRSGASKAQRQGLIQAIMMRSAGWMAIGVILWWVALIALDLNRTGVIR
jgi:hypothetical protein